MWAESETVSNTWDLTSSSSVWTSEGCVTYFSQPYGIKKNGAYIINKNISDFIKYSSTATSIKIGVKSLCNGATSSKLTVSLVDASGNVVGTGLEITPDNATAANKTTYKYVTFTSNFANIAGYKVECTTFGKNVLINGTSYEITYTPSAGGGETPGEGGGEDPIDPTPGTGESGTIVIKYNSTFAPALPTASVNTTATAHTAEGLSLKEKGIYKGSSNNYLMFTQNKGFLYNTQSLGTITSVSVTYTSGTSTSGQAGVYFGTTEQSIYTTTNNSTIKGQSKTDTWTNTTKGNGFFQLSTSNKNVQITQIEITYTSGSEGGGSGETAPSLTTDQFSWSATTATATLPNTFDNPPTLTNTENLEVTYSSSNGEVATIDENGNVTLVGVGTADIKATAGGEGTTFKETTVFYTLTVNKAPATPTDNVYVKVTSTEGITNGEYLIVYEDAANNPQSPVAFNGALATLDAVSNNIAVTITDGTIAGNTDIDAATFTIDATAGTIKSASGKYIGKTAYDNGLDSKIEVLTNTIEISEGNAVITASGNCVLRYNSASDQYRFRYYKSGQKSIALYKKASEQTVTIATCENGSVSASVANDAKVLSGTTITLSNSPATNYKLTAYDVYKTGDNTTKVTVTDGKFVMPEFDVTISATFEQLKELDKIEVNTTNVKTTFWQGETFNSTGLVVTAYYTDETSTIVTPMSITGSTAEAGTKQVTVSYTEGEITKETKYDITIKAIANEEESPYTVTEAREIIDAVGETTVDVYVQGIVSKIVTAYNSEYGNISYNISEDGKTTSAQLQAYRGKSYNGDKFTSADDIQVDDKVVVKGKLKKYDTTYEFAQDNQLVSLVRSTEPKPTAATLPFEFDGNKDDIADVVGMSQTGLGTYDNSPKLKFDTKSDNVIIHFDSEPGEFSFLLKQNGSSAGTFTVYESENGEDYTSIWSGGDLGGTGKSATIKPTISATSRYVKFEYTTKPSGTNYGLGQISIKKIDKRANAELAWSEATVSLTVGDAFTAPTFSNPNSLAVSFESSNTELATVDNAGVITLVDDATGTATITATFEGDAIYKPAEVTCVITVSPKSEKVVILAEYNGQWYALKNAEETAGKVLAALPVNYVGGKLYNVADADKATIEWQLAIDGTIATFKNGENYISGTAGSTDLKLSTTECTWTLVGTTYMLGDRTFLYRAQANGFKNYNAENNAGTDDYSALPVVTAPVYATGTIYTRSELTEGNYGTICLPYASDNYIGATFFKVVGKENNKIVFDEVTALEAGKPYIFLAEATEIKVAQIGEAAIEAGNHNSLQGTFTQIDPAVDNVLKDNYMVVNNVIKKCGANCGLAANRAYFIAGELESLGAAPSPAPSVRRISMGMAGQNTATGVDQVQGDEVPTKMIINGQLFILRGKKMYDAQGKLVK